VKVFSFSFVVYAVLLLTQPCPDAFGVEVKPEKNGPSSTRIDNTYHEESRPDECSPFCICSCCCHPVSHHSFSFAVTQKLEIVDIAVIQADYRNPTTTTYKDSIWQPPRV